MTCKNLIAICSKTHLPCPYVATNGKCREGECSNAVVPTWTELLDIYAAAVKPKVSRLKNLRSALTTLTKALGTSLDAKVAVTDEDMDAAYATLLLDHQPETIETIFCSLKACTSRRREIKIEFRKRGKQVPDIDTPEVKKRPKPIVQLTEAQRLAIRTELMTRRASKFVKDHTKFKWLWFAWRFGVRPADIGQLKWECITQRSNGSWWFEYVPTKTHGKHAGCKLSEELLEEIRPFIGKADEYVIPRFENRRPKGGRAKVTHGEYVGHHATLRRYAIAFMKSIGVEDRKPQYALRKDCSQTTIRDFGPLHEAQMLGHTPKVAMSNYADISKIDLKKGL